ncbi:MAG: hypothetical protein JJU36_08810 [Phycisphaeraceae bacterium]|nr:hypothetical protein [Phycisphaeraceae bacterium]
MYPCFLRLPPVRALWLLWSPLVVAIALSAAGCTEMPPQPRSSPDPEQAGPVLSPRGAVRVFIADLQTLTVANRQEVTERLRDRFITVSLDYRENVDTLIDALLTRYLNEANRIRRIEVAEAFTEREFAVVVVRIVDAQNQQPAFLPVFMNRVDRDWKILPRRVEVGQEVGVPAGQYLPVFSGIDPVFLDLEEEDVQTLELLRQRFVDALESLI